MNTLDIRFDVSRDWPAIQRWLQTELDTKRDQLTSTELTDTETAVIRGEIRFIKTMLRQPLDVIEAATAQVARAPDYDD